MKREKRIFSVILAFVLAFALAVPTMADTGTTPETFTLTINHDHEGHSYEAYQIFSGTLLDGDKDNDDSTVGLILSNIEWGSAISEENSVKLIEALKADTAELVYLKDGAETKIKVSEVFSSVNPNAVNSADAVANILGSGLPTVVVNRFAEIVGRYEENNHLYLGTPTEEASFVEGTSEAPGHYQIDGLTAGYYLVKDKEGTQTGNDSFYTQYILQVVHSTSVNVKGEHVGLVKGINDTIDGTFTDHEDFDINDTAYYKLDGDLPVNLYAFETYRYTFVDELPIGINFLAIEKIYIEDTSGKEVVTVYEKDKEDGINGPEDVEGITFTLDVSNVNKIVEDKQVLDPNGEPVTMPKHTITLSFNDLKTHHPGLLATDHVVVKYSARVTRDAATNQALTNTAYVIYDNNPYGDGTGKTKEAEANAYTYRLSIIKHELNNMDKKLEGVEFVLYYKDSATGENHYALVVTEEDVEAKKMINGKIVNEAMVGVVYGWTDDKDKASILDTDAMGEIHLYGLDVDTYYLEETKTIGGYNLLEGAVEIELEPDYADPESVKVTYYVDGRSQGAEPAVSIANARGNALPSTGGVGTTMFYIGGSILVFLAAVLFITKKRMQ